MRTRGIMLAAAALACAFAAPGRAGAAEVLESWKKGVAKTCAAKAQDLAGRRCFLAARTLIDFGLAFSPADQGLSKLGDAYKFAPPVPLNVVHGGFKQEELPSSAELVQNKHSVVDDVEALKAFWEKDRDEMLVSFLGSLAKSARKADEKALAGQYAGIIRGLSKQTPPWGRWDAFKAAEEYMKSLGYRSDDRTGRPISPAEISFLEQRDKVAAEKLKALKADIPVEDIASGSEFESQLGISLSKHRSDHWRIEGAFTRREDAVMALAILEEHYRLFVEKMKVSDPGRLKDPFTVAILPGKQEFENYIDMMTDESPERREFLKKSTGAHPVPSKGLFVVFDHLIGQGTPLADPSLLPLRDKMGTLAVETIAYRFGFYYFPQWVRFGLGSLFTLAVLGTAETGRISMEETTGIEQTEWYNYLKWRELMREAVERKADAGTGSLLARENANEINWTHRAKMYSIADFFVEADVESFKQFLRSVGSNWQSWKRSGDGEFAPLKAAGYTMAKLDADWRKWVMGKY